MHRTLLYQLVFRSGFDVKVRIFELRFGIFFSVSFCRKRDPFWQGRNSAHRALSWGFGGMTHAPAYHGRVKM